MPVTADHYRWLTSAEGTRWLQQCQEDQAPLHQRAQTLRRDLSAEQTHLVLEQLELRARAVAKFEHAAQMFFTRTGLEQSTDGWIAAYKARRFPGGEPCADLCCGIGGDLLSLGRHSTTVGVERDEAVAILARANCSQTPAESTLCPAVTIDDAALFPVEEYAAWHIDPDRRPQGHRTTRIELHEPSDEKLAALLARNPAAAMKLAPAAEVPAAWSAQAELEWISRDRQCRQLVAWFGPLTCAPGQRRATIVFHDQRRPRTVVGMPDLQVPVSAQIDTYVFEPDPAVLAAHLTGALAAQHGIAALAPQVAYLTGPVLIDDPALAAFEVTDVLPFQPKRLKQLLRARRIGRLEIKKRGVAQSPEQLRKQLAVPGDESATLLLARLEQGITAILARRVG